MKVVDDAHFFEERREQKINPLPAVDEERRDDRITKQQPDDKKERAVTDARQHGDAGVSQQVTEALTFRQKLHTGRHAAREIEQHECEQRRRSKEND